MNNLYGNPILNFACAMQKELDKNDHKSGWRECNWEWLIKRAKQELGEVERAIQKNKPIKVILSECADVANFMMMIADNYEEG